MAAKAGKSGSVKYDVTSTPTAVAHITEWSLSQTGDTFPSSGMGTSDITFLAGRRRWTASVTAFLDESDAAQAAIRAAVAGAAVTLELYTSASHKYSGEAFVTDFSPRASVDGVIEVTFGFQGTAALSYA